MAFKNYGNSTNLPENIKRLIVNSGSCKPKGPFPKNKEEEGRSFSEHYYKVKTSYGYVERQWLCYSADLDVVYCEPCWLFSSPSNWTQGINKWRSLSWKIKSHENSDSHLNACCIYDLWKNDKTLGIDKDLEKKI
jgi:hypothetical protein